MPPHLAIADRVDQSPDGPGGGRSVTEPSPGFEVLSDGSWECGSTGGEWSLNGCGCRSGSDESCSCIGSNGCADTDGTVCGGRQPLCKVSPPPSYEGEIWASPPHIDTHIFDVRRQPEDGQGRFLIPTETEAPWCHADRLFSVMMPNPKCNEGTEVSALPVSCGDIGDVRSGAAIWGWGIDEASAHADAIAKCEACLLRAQEQATAPAAQYDCGTCVTWVQYASSPGCGQLETVPCENHMKLTGRRSPCAAVTVPPSIVQHVMDQEVGKWLRVVLGDIRGVIVVAAAGGRLGAKSKVRVDCNCPQLE